ncbi:hypothetical protein FA95DRAFT_1555745 [Auriscalpium vulgare]|uniref:Uncharacterized protein n=1 Tax=Auriscalpium vulgare TaxID=40419 RepID=A0ACB8S1U1_9AGAM|nr:hypothetical protein FA95DRAFT_1555745 [Auriscalpium vulgare]
MPRGRNRRGRGSFRGHRGGVSFRGRDPRAERAKGGPNFVPGRPSLTKTGPHLFSGSLAAAVECH